VPSSMEAYQLKPAEHKITARRERKPKFKSHVANPLICHPLTLGVIRSGDYYSSSCGLLDWKEVA